MITPCPRCDKHPYDLLNETRYNLALLASLICTAADDRKGHLSDVTLTGLYWLISDAEEAVKTALDYYQQEV